MKLANYVLSPAYLAALINALPAQANFHAASVQGSSTQLSTIMAGAHVHINVRQYVSSGVADELQCPKNLEATGFPEYIQVAGPFIGEATFCRQVSYSRRGMQCLTVNF
jgi:hypothetical protein